MSIGWWAAVLVAAIVLLMACVHFVPRLAVFVLGPGFLVLAVVGFVENKKLFFPFQSDGSAAGMIVPVVMWVALLLCCLLGTGLIVGGRLRIAARASRTDA